MAKSKAARHDVSGSELARLRKRLRKTVAKLAKAVIKRSDARARVQALAVIADEIRAQFGEPVKAEPAILEFDTDGASMQGSRP